VSCGTHANDILDFKNPDTCFQIIGPLITFASGDWITVGSTQSDGHFPYDNSSAGVLRAYTGSAGAQQSVSITSVSPTEFPAAAASPSQRFQVVDGATEAVTYSCEGTLLKRYWAYGFLSGIVPPVPPITAQSVQGSAAIPQSATLANNITSCSFTYSAAANQRDGLVGITLQISESDENGNKETVSLYEEVHVNNAP
jgi:MSHA biogenesis protein MshO